jgi:hypothetical protein
MVGKERKTLHMLKPGEAQDFSLEVGVFRKTSEVEEFEKEVKSLEKAVIRKIKGVY